MNQSDKGVSIKPASSQIGYGTAGHLSLAPQPPDLEIIGNRVDVLVSQMLGIEANLIQFLSRCGQYLPENANASSDKVPQLPSNIISKINLYLSNLECQANRITEAVNKLSQIA